MTIPMRFRHDTWKLPLHAGGTLLAAACLIPLATGRATAAPLRVGVVCPLTTASRAFGIPHLQGIVLAAEEFRKSPGAKPDIILEIYDDRESPSLALEEVSDLHDAGAVAILGPCNSSVAREIIAAKLEIPIISALTSAADLTSSEPPFFFRANAPDTKRIDRLLPLLFNDAERRPRRLVAFYEGVGDSYGEGLAKATKDWLEAHQPEFLRNDYTAVPYKRTLSAKEARQRIAELGNAIYEDGVAILLLGLTTDARTFVAALRDQKSEAPIYIPGPEPQVFQSLVVEGVSVAGIRFVSPWDASDSSTEVISFRTAFRRAFGEEEPTYAAALAYDATKIFLHVLRAAVPTNRTPPIKEIRQRVRQLLSSNTLSPPAELVITSSHRFEQHEFKDVRFVGRQFDERGRSVPWDQKLVAPEPPPPPMFRLFMPDAWVFLVIGFAGFLGSAARECYHAPHRDTVAMLRVAARPLTLVVDPLISVAVFIAIFVGALYWDTSAATQAARDPKAMSVLGSAAGFLAGFLGIKALHALFARIGISHDPIRAVPPEPARRETSTKDHGDSEHDRMAAH